MKDFNKKLIEIYPKLKKHAIYVASGDDVDFEADELVNITIKKALENQDIVIHLACISNDPSFELNPKLGKSINLDAFEPLVQIAKKKKIKRFIYASSSSVYGIK